MERKCTFLQEMTSPLKSLKIKYNIEAISDELTENSMHLIQTQQANVLFYTLYSSKMAACPSAGPVYTCACMCECYRQKFVPRDPFPSISQRTREKPAK